MQERKEWTRREYSRPLIRKLLTLSAELGEIEELTPQTEMLFFMKWDLEMAVAQAGSKLDPVVINTLMLDGEGAIQTGAVKETEIEASIEALYHILNVEGLD